MAAFTVIDHTELGAAASSWDVTSIPTDGTYDHLMLKWSVRTDNAAYLADLDMQFNADTGSNYSRTILYANTATPASARATSDTSIGHVYGNADSTTANTFSSTTVWIPNYANTANFKQVITKSVVEGATTTDSQWIIVLNAGLWQDTSAVDQITVSYGADMVQYSTFTLYGIKGA